MLILRRRQGASVQSIISFWPACNSSARSCSASASPRAVPVVARDAARARTEAEAMREQLGLVQDQHDPHALPHTTNCGVCLGAPGVGSQFAPPRAADPIAPGA